MSSKDKKNLGNKMRAGNPVAACAQALGQGPAPARPSAVVVDIRTGRGITARRSLSPAAEGLRLMQAFFKIPDPVKRAELIKMAEDYVGRAR